MIDVVQKPDMFLFWVFLKWDCVRIGDIDFSLITFPFKKTMYSKILEF